MCNPASQGPACPRLLLPVGETGSHAHTASPTASLGSASEDVVTIRGHTRLPNHVHFQRPHLPGLLRVPCCLPTEALLWERGRPGVGGTLGLMYGSATRVWGNARPPGACFSREIGSKRRMSMGRDDRGNIGRAKKRVGPPWEPGSEGGRGRPETQRQDSTSTQTDGAWTIA